MKSIDETLARNGYELEVLKALGRLEGQVTSLAGNGQPGRVGVLEDKVDNLKSWVDKYEGSAEFKKVLRADRHSIIALIISGIAAVAAILKLVHH